MSKVVRTSRNRGEFFVRFNSKNKSAGGKTPTHMNVELPEEKAKNFARLGKMDVSTVEDVKTVFASIDVAKIAKVPEDLNKAACTANQGAITVEKTSDGVYTISAAKDSLQSFKSTAKGQGTHHWVKQSLEQNSTALHLLKQMLLK